MEGWPSGLRHRLRIPANGRPVPWVQIPPLPPILGDRLTGKTPGFGPGNLGSNPSLTTNVRWPSGKARDFESRIRGFDPYSHNHGRLAEQ